MKITNINKYARYGLLELRYKHIKFYVDISVFMLSIFAYYTKKYLCKNKNITVPTN